jgi:hypothetical protein
MNHIFFWLSLMLDGKLQVTNILNKLYIINTSTLRMSSFYNMSHWLSHAHVSVTSLFIFTRKVHNFRSVKRNIPLKWFHLTSFLAQRSALFSVENCITSRMRYAPTASIRKKSAHLSTITFQHQLIVSRTHVKKYYSWRAEQRMQNNNLHSPRVHCVRGACKMH